MNTDLQKLYDEEARMTGTLYYLQSCHMQRPAPGTQEQVDMQRSERDRVRDRIAQLEGKPPYGVKSNLP